MRIADGETSAGTRVIRRSNPSAAAATTSGQRAVRVNWGLTPVDTRSTPGSDAPERPEVFTATTRSSGMPNSLAASRPIVGTSIAASHEPAATAGAASASASDVAAGPVQARVCPLTSPRSEKSSANSSLTGRVRSRANTNGATCPASAASSPGRSRRSWRAGSIAASYRTHVRTATRSIPGARVGEQAIR